MLKRGNITGKYELLLASCFVLLTVGQTVRPLQSIALHSRAGIARRRQKLTRHILKEVGTRVADLSVQSRTEFGYLRVETPSRRPRTRQADLPGWPAHKIVHRRIPPPALDDTH